MKKSITEKLHKIILGIMMSWFVVFTACGTEEAESSSASTYVEVEKTETALGTPSEADENWRKLNSQFYKGKPVQIWSVKSGSTENETLWDVYLFYEDESKELVVSGLTSEYMRGWYLDGAGGIYIRDGKKLTKIEADGTILYTKTLDYEMQDICRLSDGSVILLVKAEENMLKLAQLDPEKGTVTIIEKITLSEEMVQFIGEYEGGLVLLDKEGVWSIDLLVGERKQLMKIQETSYTPGTGVNDFLVQSTEQAQILYSGKVETIKLSEVTEKSVIILRDWKIDSIMRSYVSKFNRSSDEYVVQIQQCDENTSITDYRNETNIQIGTGGGADIICRDAMTDVTSLMEKGALVNLKPYMERSGIKEEDYFPAAFDGWRDGDKIYGVDMFVSTYGLWLDESLVGSDGIADIETLMDTLLAKEGQYKFKYAWDYNYLLNYFFIATESLWGMVDWERATCDFDTELFVKMLQVVKRYGETEKNAGYPALADFVWVDTFYKIDTEEELKSEGKYRVGCFFEDGCYLGIQPYGLMAINANSENIEGAWAFLEFLICESTQSDIAFDQGFPVNKNAFEAVAQREIEQGAYVEKLKDGKVIGGTAKAGDEQLAKDNTEAYRALYNVTPELVDEIRDLLENTRSLPIKTGPICDIILEESAQYFNDTKRIEEIIPIIENRVQLYLEEHS